MSRPILTPKTEIMNPNETTQAERDQLHREIIALHVRIQIGPPVADDLRAELQRMQAEYSEMIKFKHRK